MPWPNDWQDLQAGSAANFNAWHAQIRKMGSPHARRIVIVTRSSTMSVAHNTHVFVPWEAEELDTANMWSSSQATRLVAPSTDLYVVAAQARITYNTSTTARSLSLWLNGTTAVARDTRQSVPRLQVLALLHLNASNYVEVVIHHMIGSAQTLLGARCVMYGTRAMTP